jgi:outer membrane protein assembly factor BamD (BamD/ComL family)
MRVGLRSSVAAIILLLVGCNRKTPPPPVADVTPPSTLALTSAKREFASGDCVSAARNFERYLELVPSSGDRDQALFHLGLINSIPECGRQDWETASGYLKRLAVEFPQSPYSITAHLILSLRDQAAQISAEIARLTVEQEQLRTEGTRLRNEIANLQNDATQLRTDSAQLNEQIARLKSEASVAAMELDKKNERIRQLSTQLDRLIKIDSQPRARQ